MKSEEKIRERLHLAKIEYDELRNPFLILIEATRIALLEWVLSD